MVKRHSRFSLANLLSELFHFRDEAWSYPFKRNLIRWKGAVRDTIKDAGNHRRFVQFRRSRAFVDTQGAKDVAEQTNGGLRVDYVDYFPPIGAQGEARRLKQTITNS